MPYQDPEVTDEDVDKRIDEMREQKAQYINVDPRPVEDGDFAVSRWKASPASRASRSSRTRWCSKSAARTPSRPSPRICAVSPPGDEKDFEVTYPDDYGSERLAGKTVKFHATLKGMRRKELPELNDEFAQELGRLPYRGRTQGRRS